MQVIRIIADLYVTDIAAAQEFHTGFLGLSIEEFNLGWVARYTAPEATAADARTRVQLVTRDEAAPADSVLSILTPDIDGAHREAQERGYEIVHPLTTEEWGVHRIGPWVSTPAPSPG